MYELSILMVEVVHCNFFSYFKLIENVGESVMDKEEKKLTFHYVMTMLAVIVLFTGIFYYVSSQVTSKDVLAFDKDIINYVQAHISNGLTSWVLRLTDLASVTFLMYGVLVVSGLLLWKKKYALMVFIITANGLGALLNKTLKWYFKRERPDILPVIMEKGFSFPSGHSMGSLIFYGSIAYLLLHIIRGNLARVFCLVGLSLLILLIGISRIYLGVHYPTDIVGGFSIGLAFLILCILAFRYYEERNHK